MKLSSTPAQGIDEKFSRLWITLGKKAQQFDQTDLPQAWPAWQARGTQ